MNTKETLLKVLENTEELDMNYYFSSWEECGCLAENFIRQYYPELIVQDGNANDIIKTVIPLFPEKDRQALIDIFGVLTGDRQTTWYEDRFNKPLSAISKNNVQQAIEELL